MARVKQFADDLGISKNQAKTLINKGRSRKDGGSQILEKVMKKPIYAKDGKVVKLKKGDSGKAKVGQFKNIANASASGKITKAEAQRKIRDLVLSKKAGGATDFGMLSVKAGIDNNPNPTQADRITGATKKARGGSMDIKKPVKSSKSRTKEMSKEMARAKTSKETPKEKLVPFKGVLKTSEGEKLRNVNGKTFVVIPPKLPMRTQAQGSQAKPKQKKMRGGGMAIQGTGFKGIR